MFGKDIRILSGGSKAIEVNHRKEVGRHLKLKAKIFLFFLPNEKLRRSNFVWLEVLVNNSLKCGSSLRG
jgi:hypothetical protein